MSKLRKNSWRFSRARKQRMNSQTTLPEEAAEQEEEIIPEEVPVLEVEAVTEEAAEPEPETETTPEETAEPEPETETVPEEMTEPEAETVPEETAEAETVPEESAEPAAETEVIPEETAEAEAEAVSEEMTEPEMEIVPEEESETEEDLFGEEVSAARELPARFFDEEDVEERRKARKKEKKRKKSGKKKLRLVSSKKESEEVMVQPVRVGELMLGDGIPKICIPVMGYTKDEILEQAVRAQAMQPDLVEWRADHFRSVIETEKTHDILKELREIFGTVPLLFTYRTESEGGFGRISWEQYAELLVWAAGLREVSLVDVEAMGLDVDTEGLIRAIQDKGTPVIASVHYYEGTPDKKELREAVRFLKASGGDVIKLAAMAVTEKDALDLMEWTYRQVRRTEQPLITVSMGAAGKLSRISGGITGSAVTFGCAGEASAPGQIPADELRMILKQLEF